MPTTPAARARPMPRRGHTKSRLGCAICKGRKVKCDEVTPECGPCQRLGLRCLFGQRKDDDAKETLPVPSVALIKPMTSGPPSFDIDDLRFFSHFLLSAYPALPIGGRKVWEQMSQMSHEYDFLMHSMLALGASHLSLVTADSFSQAALRHRFTAIKGINEFLSRTAFTTAHADVALATMLALTFQASHMPDGLADFLITVRGCCLVGNTIVSDFERSEFASFSREAHVDRLLELVTSEHRCLDRTIADEFSASTKRLAPLCHAVTEVEFLATLSGISSSAAYNPTEGHERHISLYNKLGEMSVEDFITFTDAKNPVGQLLIVHMLILDVIMSRKIVEDQGPDDVFNCCKPTAVIWIENTCRALPEEYQQYAKWARSFASSLDFSIGSEDAIWKPSLLQGRGKLADLEMVEIET